MVFVQFKLVKVKKRVKNITVQKFGNSMKCF